MTRILFAFAFGLLALTAPARAADVATLSCVIDKLSPDLRAKLVANYDAHIRDAKVEMDQALDGQMVAFADACRAKNGWTENERQSALIWTRSTIALPIGEKYARERGIDVDTIWKIWRAQPVETRSRRLQREDLDKLAAAFQSAGLFNRQGDASVIGVLLAYMSTNEYGRAGFIAG